MKGLRRSCERYWWAEITYGDELRRIFSTGVRLSYRDGFSLLVVAFVSIRECKYIFQQ